MENTVFEFEFEFSLALSLADNGAAVAEVAAADDFTTAATNTVTYTPLDRLRSEKPTNVVKEVAFLQCLHSLWQSSEDGAGMRCSECAWFWGVHAVSALPCTGRGLSALP